MSEGKLPKWLVEEADGSLTVKFDDMKRLPKIDGTEIKSLKMREATVDDELAVANISSIGKRESTAIANLCEVAPDAIGGFTMRQYSRLQDAYNVFLS